MKQFQLAALLLLATLSACNKDDQAQPNPNNPTPQQTTKKLAGYTYQGVDINPLVIKYDAKGRVVHQSDGEDIVDVSYTANQVHIVSKRTSVNSAVYNFTGKLNAQGFVTEGSAVSAFNGIPRNVTYTFEYDATGYLKRVISNYNAGEFVYDYRYTYKNGDMASFEVYVNNVYDYGGAWEYDLNTEDRSGLSWQHLNVGNTFTGKPNKHLATKYTGFRDGKVSWYVDYVYTFDAEGYPVSGALAFSSGNAYTVFYKYQ
ncbi:MAG: DUF4595 domain-containing protein [Saprospiraceae bacterium]